MAKRNDLKEPIKFHSKGMCPLCHFSTMVYNSYKSNHIFLDEEGAPVSAHPTEKAYIICPACGFTGEVGTDFIADDELCFVFATEARRLQIQWERAQQQKEYIATHGDLFVGMHSSNPFMFTEEEK